LRVAKQQCKLWRQQHPTPQQLQDIDKIESCNQDLEKTNIRILFLANHYKDHTINKILAKDDAELAIDVLLGKLGSSVQRYVRYHKGLSKCLILQYKKAFLSS